MILKSRSLSLTDNEAVGSSIAIKVASWANALAIITSHLSATESSRTGRSRLKSTPILWAAAAAIRRDAFQSTKPARFTFGAPSKMFWSELN